LTAVIAAAVNDAALCSLLLLFLLLRMLVYCPLGSLKLSGLGTSGQFCCSSRRTLGCLGCVLCLDGFNHLQMRCT
jgi:hypothetical protein